MFVATDEKGRSLGIMAIEEKIAQLEGTDSLERRMLKVERDLLMELYPRVNSDISQYGKTYEEVRDLIRNASIFVISKENEQRMINILNNKEQLINLFNTLATILPLFN